MQRSTEITLSSISGFQDRPGTLNANQQSSQNPLPFHLKNVDNFKRSKKKLDPKTIVFVIYSEAEGDYNSYFTRP